MPGAAKQFYIDDLSTRQSSILTHRDATSQSAEVASQGYESTESGPKSQEDTAPEHRNRDSIRSVQQAENATGDGPGDDDGASVGVHSLWRG